MKFKLLLATGLLMPALTFANEKPQLSPEDIQSVVSGIITLKTNCVTNELANCFTADAVIKMFRATVQETADEELKKYYLEKYSDLLDGFVEKEATSK